jgi:hypothetical protein
VNTLSGVFLCESCGHVHQKAFGKDNVIQKKHVLEVHACSLAGPFGLF